MKPSLMNLLTLDLWGYLSEFINNDRDKCRLMMTCKKISKCRFYFYRLRDIYYAKKSRWFNHFTNVHNIHDINALPLSIKHLSFGNYFNKPFDSDKIPPSVTHVTFGNGFDQKVDKFPPKITHLTFGFAFNQPIDNCIPYGVTHLTFNYYFNQNVDNLPSSIVELSFGCRFNKPINNIPSSVTNLRLGCFFNQLAHNIPTFIKCITFSESSHNSQKSSIQEFAEENNIELIFYRCA